MSSKNAPRTPVGRIVGAFGIRGQIKVEPLTEFVERLNKGVQVYLDGEPMIIRASALHKGRFLLSFSEIQDATAAEALQWKILEADDTGRPPLEEDEYLTRDLIGLLVLTEEGRPLGKVDEVLAYPAHDILVVGKVMIPAVKEFVKKVDLEGRQIVIKLLPGMEDE